MCLDAAQLSAPVALEQCDPVVNGTERFGVDPHHRPAAVASHADQPNIAEYLQVFRHRGLPHFEGVHDVAHGTFVGCEELENVPPPGFGDGVEGI